MRLGAELARASACTSPGRSTAALPTTTRSTPLREQIVDHAPAERTPPPTWMFSAAATASAHDDAAIGERAVLRAVEIDDVQPARAERAIARQQLVRLVVVARLRVEVALEQAHAAAVAQIDGGNEHASAFRPQEVGEDARADRAGALGMKLRAAEVAAAHDRGERARRSPSSRRVHVCDAARR